VIPGRPIALPPRSGQGLVIACLGLTVKLALIVIGSPVFHSPAQPVTL